jgi:hypothetical protein
VQREWMVHAGHWRGSQAVDSRWLWASCQPAHLSFRVLLELVVRRPSEPFPRS